MSKVFFVGCGPGDPELITVKASRLIQEADVVVYSGSLIPEPILKLCRNGEMHDASGLVRGGDIRSAVPERKGEQTGGQAS